MLNLTTYGSLLNGEYRNKTEKIRNRIEQIITFNYNFCEGPVYCGPKQPNYCDCPDPGNFIYEAYKV